MKIALILKRGGVRERSGKKIFFCLGGGGGRRGAADEKRMLWVGGREEKEFISPEDSGWRQQVKVNWAEKKIIIIW